MSPPFPNDCVAVTRFPRVSGDEPTSLTLSTWNDLFSPRERG